MYIPRRLKLAAEYKQSLTAVRKRGLPELDNNLQAVRGVAKFNPEAATQVANSSLRIAQVYDEANGYSLALYFEGGPMDEASTLVRLEAFEIEPDFHPWSEIRP